MVDHLKYEKAWRRDEIIAWLDSPRETRCLKDELRGRCKMRRDNFASLFREVQIDRERARGLPPGKVMDALSVFERIGEGEFEYSEWIKENRRRVTNALIDSCEKGNAQALRLFLQLDGQLKEQPKDNGEFDHAADDYARAYLRAKREGKDESG